MSTKGLKQYRVLVKEDATYETRVWATSSKQAEADALDAVADAITLRADGGVMLVGVEERDVVAVVELLA